ncbi:ABC transporter ATP-binding protein [Staphylococcus cohnii]|uniref:ABC transporter ATP-binding protein n=1 Tax=Staphylococcus cohnii TaxID=29382 RepID=UPI003CEC5C2B
MIEVNNLSKSFGDKQVLKDINVAFEKGEIVGLIGPSGTGKTTLIQCMLGMERIDVERIDVGWVTIDDVEMPNRKILGDIGYMAQSDALYTDLTGRENLEFFGSIYIKKRKDIKKRVEICSNMVKLQEALDKKVSTYSGGMKRRLSLAISFLQDPKILILDEPTVGIDPKLRQAVWKDLDAAKSEGKSILVTTHVLDEATRCDRLLLMNHGEIIAMGSPQDIKTQYQAESIEEVFLKMED